MNFDMYLTQEEIDQCKDKNGILDRDRFLRMEHKKELELGITNIGDFKEWESITSTFSRPWM